MTITTGSEMNATSFVVVIVSVILPVLYTCMDEMFSIFLYCFGTGGFSEPWACDVLLGEFWLRDWISILCYWKVGMEFIGMSSIETL